MGLTSNTGAFNAAASIYGVDDEVMFKRPRQKFNFSVFMQLDDAVTLSDASYGKSFVFDRVLGVDMPDYQYNVTRLNQYNHQRFVTTRQEILPATINFYDTMDNQFQSLLTDYAGYYYSQGLTELDMPFSSNANAGGISTPSGLTAVAASGRFFFNRISIGTIDTRSGGAETGRTVNMINCMITSVSHDRLDYADSGPLTWTVQFQPEHIEFNTIGGTSV